MLHTASFVAILFAIQPAQAQADSTYPATEPASQPALQCGHYAIQHCCQLLGVPTQMEAIANLLPAKPAGHSLLEIAEALEHLGLNARGRLEDFETLKHGAFPVIAHSGQSHFVVVERADDAFVMLLDGDGRRRLFAARRFQEQWDGKLLRVTRADPDRPLPDCPREQSSPRIQFQTLFIDKGEIPYDAPEVAYKFGFRNLGTGDLLIKRVQTSCSCLKSEKPEKAIAPGESGKVVLQYRSTENGVFMQNAFVETNDPCIPVIQLTAAGNTARTLVVDPPQFDLGKMVPGQAREIACAVRYLGDTPLVLNQLRCDLVGSSVTHVVVTDEDLRRFNEARIIARNVTPYSIIVRLRWTAGPEVRAAKGLVQLVTNIPGFEQVNIPVKAEVIAPVALVPAALAWDASAPDSMSPAVTAVSRDGSPFRIMAVDLRDSGLTCDYPSTQAAEQAAIRLHGRPRCEARPTVLELNVAVETSTGYRFTLPLPVYVGHTPVASTPNAN